MKKDLYFFLAHMDDFEISCIGYLYKNSINYENIKIVLATSWSKKDTIWKENLDLLNNELDLNLESILLNYEQRTLMTKFDSLKDDFYKLIDFNKRFDIVTHDKDDCHTDHFACNMVANGIFKYASKFTTIYSPSSRNFKANYWVAMPKEIFSLKKQCIDKYNIDNEQSYSKMGYYMQNEEHYNIGRAYYLENFAYQEYEHYEVYRVLKNLE